MKIVKDFPPNYQQIIARIPAVGRRLSIIFTYGDTVYCPGGNTNLPDHLIAHEAVHSEIQAEMGVEAWWELYLTSTRFRLEQELLAYRKQYEVLQRYDRATRRMVLGRISKSLSGAMYGKLVDKSTAQKLITGEAEL